MAPITDCSEVQHDDEGDTPLIAAARKGHTITVGTLLDAGASPLIENDFGRSALHAAAVAGHVEVCLLLLAVRNVMFLIHYDVYSCALRRPVPTPYNATPLIVRPCAGPW
jgi:ankyrin repeat protein